MCLTLIRPGHMSPNTIRTLANLPQSAKKKKKKSRLQEQAVANSKQKEQTAVSKPTKPAKPTMAKVAVRPFKTATSCSSQPVPEVEIKAATACGWFRQALSVVPKLNPRKKATNYEAILQALKE